MRRVIIFVTFICVFFCVFADEQYCTSNSVCDWASGKIDSQLSIDVERMGLSLPSAKTTSYHTLKKYLPSLLKNAYLSIIMDSSHRLGDYLARGDIDLNNLDLIMGNGEEKSPIFSDDLSRLILFHRIATNDIAQLFVRHEVSRLPLMHVESCRYMVSMLTMC